MSARRVNKSTYLSTNHLSNLDCCDPYTTSRRMNQDGLDSLKLSTLFDAVYNLHPVEVVLTIPLASLAASSREYMAVLYTTGTLAAPSNVIVSGAVMQRCSETIMLVVKDPLEHTIPRSPTRCLDTPGPTSVMMPLHSQPRPLPMADGSATTPTAMSTSWLFFMSAPDCIPEKMVLTQKSLHSTHLEIQTGSHHLDPHHAGTQGRFRHLLPK